MTRLILALIRFCALCLSFILATLAAALFLIFALFLGGDTTWLADDPAVFVASVTLTAGIWFSIAQLTFLPFLAITAICEFARLKSMTVNMLIGGLCALVFLVISGQTLRMELELPYSDQEIWIAVLAAGFVGGFVHWLVAGCRAGNWLGPQKIEGQLADDF